VEGGYDIEALLAWRAARDEEFRTSYASPLPEEHMESFHHLRYFEPDAAMAVSGPFAPAEGKFDITSSTGSVSGYDLAGRVTLTVNGETRTLVVLGVDDDMFIPFRDTTCGTDSYVGGRYVSVERTKTDSAVIDFNRAVNPYCAYDEDFSCPLPPADNWFNVPIRVGEMDYRPDN
jgi:uncharacterized protein (DUF1684 family)